MLFLISLSLSEEINLDRAISLAREQSAAVLSARISAASASIAAETQAQAWQPNLSASVGLSGNVDPTDTFGAAQAQLSSSMPIWQGGALRAELAAARAGQVAADAGLAQVEQEVVAAVAAGLLAVGEAEALAAVRAEAQAAEEALLARIAAYVDAGARTRADLLQQQAAVATARAEAQAATQAVLAARMALLTLLRLDPAADWQFVSPEVAPSLGQDVPALVQRALGRPELAAAEATVEAQVAGVDAAQAERWPALNLSVGASTGWLGTDPTTVPTQLGSRAQGSATLSLSVPILDRGVNRAAVAQAELSVAQASLSRDTLQEAATVAVYTQVAAIAAAEATLQATEARAAAATAALDVVQQRYDAGAATVAELAEARRAFVEAARAVIIARGDLLESRYALALTVGAL